MRMKREALKKRSSIFCVVIEDLTTLKKKRIVGLQNTEEQILSS